MFMAGARFYGERMTSVVCSTVYGSVCYRLP